MSVLDNPREAAGGWDQKVLPSPEAAEAIAVLDRMLADRAGDPATQLRSDEFFARDYGELWSALCREGWTSVAAAADEAGPPAEGLDLVDLLSLAETWGRHLIPLPLLQTLLVRRWSAAAGPAEQALTFAVGRPSGAPLAPFAGRPGVSCVDQLPAHGSQLDAWPSDSAASAPSLPLGTAATATALASQVRREVAALALAEAAGGAAMCLERSVAYAKTRVQFGRTIGSMQAVKHHLANMHMDTELARSSALAVAVDTTGPSWPLATLGFDYCAKVWETAIQVHGGIGFTWEAGLHFYSWHQRGLRAVAQAAAHQSGEQSQPGPGAAR